MNNIKSFGSLNFISVEFDQLQLPVLITKHPGERQPQAVLSFSDAIKSLWRLFLRAGIVRKILPQTLKRNSCKLKTLRYVSADTLLPIQKSLAIDNEIHIRKSGSVNDISKHAIFNALNLDQMLPSKTLQPNQFYDFDFEKQFISCEKYDSKKGYKIKQCKFQQNAFSYKYAIDFVRNIVLMN